MKSTILESIPHLAGMLMVMISLMILWILCEISSYIIRYYINFSKNLYSNQKNDNMKVDKKVNREEEIIVVIGAVVSYLYSNKKKIIHIKPSDSNREKYGRMSVMQSHKIR
jgi:hypothetical protein